MMNHNDDQKRWLHRTIFLLFAICLLVGCSGPEPTPVGLEEEKEKEVEVEVAVEVPTEVAPSPSPSASPVPSATARASSTAAPTKTPRSSPTKTRTPRPTGTPTRTSTPTASPTLVPGWYEIEEGDTLLEVAISEDTSVDEILELNNISEETKLRIGRVLAIPSEIDLSLPESYLIEDSELVYGATYVDWDTSEFIEQQGGFLAEYEAYGRDAGQIIDQMAVKYHVGPRALLASIEMMSGWVTKRKPKEATPFGGAGGGDLHWWTQWAAERMMEGYYGQLEGRRDWVVMANRVQVRLYPGTNPGSAAIANLLAGLVWDADELSELLEDGGFEKSYRRLFGKMDIEAGPVLPPNGEQPYFALPWTPGEQWVFTGGPHGGYGDYVTGWAALDFAPPIPRGCWPSEFPARAVARGVVIESREGEVWIDTDDDGDVRTGWVLYYLHLDTEGRLEAGEKVKVGDVVGYPSCEGGIANASHLHIARMYNGQWMPAHAPVPFQLGNWTAQGLIGSSYDGRLISITGRVLTAVPARVDARNVFPNNNYDNVRRTSGH
ncbi:MAG: LysM peptidoglycan-binding domain-containing protein [Ardenticatenaceae bacterium]